MPWAKRHTIGCCLFCRQEYQIYEYHRGANFHHCPGADKRKKEIKAERNRIYWAAKQANKGLTVQPKRPPKRKIPPSERRRALEFTGVYIRPAYHVAPCGHRTINRWNCRQCAERKTNGMDVDMMIEVGESRRMGVRR